MWDIIKEKMWEVYAHKAYTATCASEKSMHANIYWSQLSIITHYSFRTAATHFIEIQQLRLLYHKVAYTKQQLTSNNRVYRIDSVQTAANSM